MRLACALPILMAHCEPQATSNPPAAAPPQASVATTAAPSPASAADRLPRPTVPGTIAAPAGQEVVLKAAAKGDQVYTCKEKDGARGVYEWTLKAPDAMLFDETGKAIGKHYAGPTWELVDGSKVGGKVRAKVDSPDAGAIAWLLLETTSNAGNGRLGAAKSVQRVDTSGGMAPASGCDAAHVNSEARIAYAATYYFYGP